jgi:hypothetical protein
MEDTMRLRSLLLAPALAASLGIAIAATPAQAFDDAAYPDWAGSWLGIGGGSYDTSKPKGLGQETPLKPEFEAVLERSLADIAAGGQGNDPGYRCASHGMPRVIANVPIYFLVMPETTYVILQRLSQVRRVYTDGRDWPAQLERSSVGYSIGRWLDTTGSGRLDTLTIETRGMRGARVYDSSGAPVPSRRRHHRQGAHQPRPGQSGRAAQRDHHDRPCAHPSVDGDPQLSAHAQSRMARIRLCRG